MMDASMPASPFYKAWVLVSAFHLSLLSDLRLLIVGTTLIMMSTWDFRFGAKVRSLPYSLMTWLGTPPNDYDDERVLLARRILDTDDIGLKIKAP